MVRRNDHADTVVLNTLVGNPDLNIQELFSKLPEGLLPTTDALRHRINRLFKEGLVTRHGPRNKYTWRAGNTADRSPKPRKASPKPDSAEAIVASLPDGDGPAPAVPEDPALQELDIMREIHVLMKRLPDTQSRARVFNWVNQNFNLGHPMYDGQD